MLARNAAELELQIELRATGRLCGDCASSSMISLRLRLVDISPSTSADSYTRGGLLAPRSIPLPRNAQQRFAGENVGAGEAEMGERTEREIDHDAAMVEKPLKFYGCGTAVVGQ